MKKLFSLILSFVLVISIIFSNHCIETCFDSLFVKANAFDVSCLSFELNEDYQSYSVSDCKSTAEGDVIIPSVYDELPVTAILEYAFSYCEGIKSVTIPDSVSSIGSGAFYGCSNLVFVDIVGEITEICESTFSDCVSLTSISFPETLTTIGNSAFDSCTSLVSINLPDSVTFLDEFAFYQCTELTSIHFPESLDTIGSYAFSDCGKLFFEQFPLKLTTIGENAFYNCSSLTSVTISDNVKSLGSGAFSKCEGITKLNVGCGIVNCGSYPFLNSPNIKEIFVNSTCLLSYMPSTSNLENLVIGDKVTSIPDDCFSSCSKLTTVKIGDGVKSVGNFAFNECESLVSLKIGKGVETIGQFAFNSCSNLTSVKFGESLIFIDEFAFSCCSSLNELILPEGLKTLAGCSFDGLDNCSSILIPKSVSFIEYDAFEGFSGTIYCYYDSVGFDYAVENGIDYIIIDISATDNSYVDYINGVIYTDLSDLSDFSTVVSQEPSVTLSVSPAVSQNNYDILGTGSIVSVFRDGEKVNEFKLSVKNDLTGDGICNVIDVFEAERFSNNHSEPTKEQLYAINGSISEEITVNSYQDIVNAALKK